MKTPLLIGKTDLTTKPGIVAVVAGDKKQCLNLAHQACADGADILELRGDLCRTNGTEIAPAEIASIVAALRREVALPILLTIRRLSEGGYFFGEEKERLGYFRSLLPDVDAIDVELYDTQEVRGEIVREAHSLGKTVVLSYHNFRRTPALGSFAEIVEDAMTVGADVAKIAVMAEGPDDVESLMKFTAEFNSQTIALATMAMGDIGRISRVVNPFLGSCLTYGYVGEIATTPGQVPVKELRAIIDLFPGGRIRSEDLGPIFELVRKSVVSANIVTSSASSASPAAEAHVTPMCH